MAFAVHIQEAQALVFRLSLEKQRLEEQCEKIAEEYNKLLAENKALKEQIDGRLAETDSR